MTIGNIKISIPTFDEVVPSSKKKVKVTPFRVGDEKALLIASGSDSKRAMYQALKQVMENCVKGVDVEELTPYDIEYLFLRLRAHSIGETTELGLGCIECKTVNRFAVDLSTVNVEFNESHTDKVKITDEITFILEYPDPEIIMDLDIENPDDALEIMVRCVKIVYDGEEKYDIDPTDWPEVKTLIEQLTSDQFKSLRLFFDTLPKVSKHIEFECGSCGHHNKQVIEGISNFF